MNKKDLLRLMTLQFFIIYTLTMFATAFFVRLNEPVVTDIPVSFIWQAAVFTVFAVLPTAIYYSKENLGKKQFWIRTAIHTIALEAVLMTAGHFFEMYNGIFGAAAFFVTVLIVDILVRLFSYVGDASTAEKINRKLRENRKYKN